jgi:hypothetical protein
MRRVAAVLLAAVAIAVAPVVSTTRAQTSTELWTQAEFLWNMSSRYRMLALLQLRRHDDIGDSEAGYGIHFDYTDIKHGYVRAGYRYLYALDEPEHPENRGLVEMTLHGAGATRFVNRFRTELRFMDDGFSYRFRERVRIERDVEANTARFLPYAMAEPFYDSKVGGFDRVRYQAGIEIHFTKSFALDLAFVRQDTWRGDKEFVNAPFVRGLVEF